MVLNKVVLSAYITKLHFASSLKIVYIYTVNNKGAMQYSKVYR